MGRRRGRCRPRNLFSRGTELTTSRSRPQVTPLFGPVTPYATIASLFLALTACAYLWALGIVLNVVLLFVGIALTANRDKVRQVGTGMTIGYLVFVVGFALFIFVDYLKTKDLSAESSSDGTSISRVVDDRRASSSADTVTTSRPESN